MLPMDLRIALCEEHRRELVEEAEQQRFIGKLLRQQRHSKMRRALVRARRRFFRKWDSIQGTVALFPRKKEGVLGLPLYSPDSDRDPDRNN